MSIVSDKLTIVSGAVLQTVQRPKVQSDVYGSVHYIESLKSLIIVVHGW